MKNSLVSLVALVAIVVATVALNAEGQLNTTTLQTNVFEWGSQAKVEDHVVKLTDQFWLDVYQVWTNGVVFYAQPTFIRGFTNMAEMNAFLQQQTAIYATNIFNTVNAHLDQEFIVRASSIEMSDGFYATALCYYPFYLIKNGTNYSLPNFSTVQMKLPSNIPYKVPNIDWMVMEVYDQNGNLTNYFDSRYDPYSTYVDTNNEVLDLPTSYLTNNSNFRLIVVSGTNYENYRVYDGTGSQISELPVTISQPIIYKNKTVSVSVIPGEIGRYLTLQGSIDLVNWTNLTSGYLTYYSGYDPGFTYSETNSYKSRFFRVRADSGPK